MQISLTCNHDRLQWAVFLSVTALPVVLSMTASASPSVSRFSYCKVCCHIHVAGVGASWGTLIASAVLSLSFSVLHKHFSIENQRKFLDWWRLICRIHPQKWDCHRASFLRLPAPGDIQIALNPLLCEISRLNICDFVCHNISTSSIQWRFRAGLSGGK